jgi:hypothetical protein
MTRWAGPQGRGTDPSNSLLMLVSLVALAPACSLGGLASPGRWRRLPGQGRCREPLRCGNHRLGRRRTAVSLLAGRSGFPACGSCSRGRHLRLGEPSLGLQAQVGRRRRQPDGHRFVGGRLPVGFPQRSPRRAFPANRFLSLQPSRYGLLAVVARGSSGCSFTTARCCSPAKTRSPPKKAFTCRCCCMRIRDGFCSWAAGSAGVWSRRSSTAPERLDYVEMDPGVFPLARKFADEETRAALADPRVHAMASDGRRCCATRLAATT